MTPPITRRSSTESVLMELTGISAAPLMQDSIDLDKQKLSYNMAIKIHFI